MSKFKESLTYIKYMINDPVYHTNNEEVFEKKYLEDEKVSKIRDTIDQNMLLAQQNAREQVLQKRLFDGYYENLYASFLFIYEIEVILDEIEYGGMTFSRAESLVNMCSHLCIISTNVMHTIDEEPSFCKKNTLCNNLYTMACCIYESAQFIFSITDEDISQDDTFTVTPYDEIANRLYCKYIRNGISVIKLFGILAMMQSTPICSEEVHYVAKVFQNHLREVLYNKRIMKIVVDSDVYGNSNKAHASTRIKIIFALDNFDRYCIRLDLPHEGENSIHFNINEPAHKRSTGFPFTGNELNEALRICKSKAFFEKIFYYQDDLYWFRSGYSAIIKRIANDEGQQQELEKFRNNRGHLVIMRNSEENLDIVTECSKVFTEMMTDYLGITIYGDTSTDDDGMFSYILFRDFLFEAIVKIKEWDEKNRILIDDMPNIVDNSDGNTNDKHLKELLSKYILEKFPDDTELILCTKMDGELCDFVSKCLDRMDQLGI